MKTLEATISLFIFLIFVTSVLADLKPQKIDDSLYRYELASDAWRVLYLRDDLHNFSDDSLNLARDRAENDLTKMTEITGLCMNIEGVRVQSKQCRSKELKESTVAIKRRLFAGDEAKEVSLTISPK
ncbi:MAG: hypothetical protein Q7S22_00670 [Candidatus Micrarchaeota archaeon]|nr:hypothetical protein [Candidatus Micrarchaeota archaeon]